MENQLLQLIQTLSDLSGAPGFEKPVAQAAAAWAKDLGAVQMDKMNNFYLSRHENEQSLDAPVSHWGGDTRRLRIQLDAHLDEVAFMVQGIQPDGMIRMAPLGGWVASNVPAHRMRILRQARPEAPALPALTVSKPPHYMSEEERRLAPALGEVLLDIGAGSREEVLAAGVEPGDPVVPDVKSTYEPERDVLLGKAFDCRSGCACALETLRRLQGESLAGDVFVALSTQEEVGTRGAEVTARRVRPDLAIVFEGCPADDSFAQPFGAQTALRKGPMLRHLDARMITHPGFQRFALNVAKQNDIPVQRAVRTGGSTNGAPIHRSGDAVPCIVIGIPVRYIHTHYGIATLFDHEQAVRLAVALLRRLDGEIFDQL